MVRQFVAAVTFGLAGLVTVAATAADFRYVDDAEPLLAAGAVAVDARPLDACVARSINGARCLSAADALGPHRRLADIPDLLWLLGTAELTGAETALVVGDDPTARDFVAGLLYLLGQREVAVLRPPLSRGGGLDAGRLGPGQVRAATRIAVFRAPVRDDAWLFRRDMTALLAGDPMLLDGRDESEYWGETVRAARGGHLPGAVHLSATALRAALGRGERPPSFSGLPIAYAHDPVEGIAFMTLLRAGAGLAARVYTGGWAEWAADGALPADAVTYPDRRSATVSVSTATAASDHWTFLLIGVLVGAVLTVGGFVLGRRWAA